MRNSLSCPLLNICNLKYVSKSSVLLCIGWVDYVTPQSCHFLNWGLAPNTQEWLAS